MPALVSGIQSEINKLTNDSGLVELFILDARNISGGTIYYYTKNVMPNGDFCVYQGHTYLPLPISAQGFDVTSSGTMPKPVITLSDVNKVLLSAVLNEGDLVGATFTRLRTYTKYLDNGTNPNPTFFIGPEKWLIEMLVLRTHNIMQWQLTTPIDRLGFRFGRQVLKDKFVIPTGLPNAGMELHLYAPGIHTNRTR